MLTNISDIQKIRQNLRRTVLGRRDRLPAAELAAKSRQATVRLRQMAAFRQAANLFIYVSYRSELDTADLIRQCIARGGCRVAVPRTIPEQGLEAYEIKDPEQDLVPGFCSIPEPLPARTVKVEPAVIDLVVLPGSVFDPRGGRLGYGGGYYDRFLSHCAPGALRIGLALELQVVAQVPVMAHDIPLDYLVTEERIIRCEDAYEKNSRL